MSDEKIHDDFHACDALLCDGSGREDFIKENIDRIDTWKDAAEAGDPFGQLLYGLCYFYGYGLEEDEEIAVQWFLKSAEQGNAQAQCSLGLCYQQGWGVECDLNVANDWFVKAAVQGHRAACAELPLALSIQLGIGTHKPLTKEIIDQFLKDEDSIDWEEFTSIDDEAACILPELVNTLGGELHLAGLITLPDAAAESLGNCKGNLYFDSITELSDAAAESLSNHTGELSLNGLMELSDSAAQSFSKHQGKVSLTQVVKLSESAATYIRPCINPKVEYCGVPIKQILISVSDESQIDLETKLTAQRVSLIQNLIDEVQIVIDLLGNIHIDGEYQRRLENALKEFAFGFEIVQSGGRITTAIAEAMKSNLDVEDTPSDQEVANHLLNCGFQIDNDAKEILAERFELGDSVTDK